MPTLEELDALNDELNSEPIAVPEPLAEQAKATPSVADLDALNEQLNSEPTARPEPGPATDAGGRVYVRDRFGQIGTVAPEELGALGPGATPVAREEIERELQAREYGDVGSQVAAGLEGVAQGATLGAYGGVARLVSPEYRQKMELREEFYPVTSTVGQVVGAVAPVLLSGGTGALGAAARAAPSALAERAGEAVAAAAARRMGASLAARTAARGIAGAVEGGLAAAAMTAAEELPAVAADPEKWGEHLAAVGWSALQGTALGAGAGLILGGATEALSDVAASLGTKAARRAEKAAVQAADEANPVTPENYAEITAQLETRPLVSSQLLDESPPGFDKQVKEIAAAQHGFVDAVQDGTRAIESDLNTMFKNIDSVDEGAGIRAKNAAIRRANESTGFPIESQDVDGVVGALDASLKDLRSAAGAGDAALQSGGGLAAVARVQKQIAHSQAKIRSALGKGLVGDAFIELDNLKRTLGQASNTRNRLAQDVLREQYAAVRGFMEDADTWGELAEIQRQVNAPWADRISRQGDQRVGGFSLRSGERSEDPFEALSQANGGKIQGFLGKLGEAGSEGEEQAFRLWLRSMAKDATTRAQAWGTDELRDRAVAITAAAQKIENRMDQVAILARQAEAGKRLLARNASSDLLAGAASFVHPSLGWVVSGGGKVKLTVQRALAEKSAGVESWLDRAAERFVKTSVKAARGAAQATETTANVTAIAAGVITAKRFAAALDEARALSDPASEQTANLQDDAALMDEISPGLGAAYVAKTTRRANFIASKLPKQQPGLYAPPPRMDPMREKKVKRYVAAAYYPEKALDRLAKGDASREDIETLKTLFPRMFQDFVARTEQTLAESKTVLPHDAQLKVYLQTGIVTRPSLAPEAIAKQQATAAAIAAAGEKKEQQQAANRAKLATKPEAYMTRSDRIMSGN